MAWMAARLGGGGDVEVGEADRQVDGILERPGQFEGLADSGGLDVGHPVGDPGGVHGCVFQGKGLGTARRDRA